MSTPTNSFPAAASFALTDTFLMNVAGASSKVTGTNAITSLGVPTLAGANTFTAINTFSASRAIFGTAALKPFTDVFGTEAIGVTKANGTAPAAFFGGYQATFGQGVDDSASVQAGIDANGTGNFAAGSTGRYGFSATANGSWASIRTVDTALMRAAAAVVEINTGTAGGGGGLQLNEMTAPTGVANSARLFTQDLAGKTQLMVIFGSGVAQQLAIEL